MSVLFCDENKEELMTRKASAAVEEAVVTQPTTADLGSMNKGALLDLAEERGVIVDAAWSKPQIVHAIKVAMEIAAGFAGVPKIEESVPITPCVSVINALSALVDQNAHFKPPATTVWGCNAPSDQVLRWMIEKGLPADLFQDGAALAVFLRVPGNAKLVKASGIHIAFPPWQGKELIRVERCDPGQYQRNDI
jgi:hypothetical protein